MKQIKTVAEISNLTTTIKGNGQSIGFVPTMGALHQGHLALVKKAVAENNVNVVSIFVNPTQFNDKSDLKNYPRTLEADIEKLIPILKENDIVFTPSETEIYPEEDTRIFEFGLLDKVMEGRFRPGHFNGVAQVVSKLFAMVNPTRAYFGLKDYQQLAIIKSMVTNYMPNNGIEIIPHETVRENDGLAMSSRNQLLTKDERAIAPKIFECLSQLKTQIQKLSLSDLRAYAEGAINSEPRFKLDYFELIDSNSLQPVFNDETPQNLTACIAVFLGKVRLIDNIQIDTKPIS